MGSCLLTTGWQAHPQVLSCCHMLQCVQESLLSARVQICFVLQAQTQHMAAANGGHFRENLSLFWESYVIKRASETQLVDVTPFLYERTREHLLVEHHIARHTLTCRGAPSGSQEMEHGQWPWLQQRATCLCLVNSCQGLHICDTTAFIFQGIVSKKYEWCLFFSLFPSIVRFSVPFG